MRKKISSRDYAQRLMDANKHINDAIDGAIEEVREEYGVKMHGYTFTGIFESLEDAQMRHLMEGLDNGDNNQ